MLSLRTRFACLLVTAVVLVLFVATFVTVSLLQKPPEAIYAETIVEKARYAAALSRIDPEEASRLGIVLAGPPDPGSIDADRTAKLAAPAGAVSTEMAVMRRNADEMQRVAVRVDETRWAYFSFPGFHPFPLGPLVAYLAVIAAGLIVIALYASDVMMRPLRVLDAAIARIRPDGVIPSIPERGPAEVCTTARTINRLSARLNAATASRMRLVAAAGHDMRTPMTRMRLRTEFVTDPEERQAWLKDLDELDHMADSAIRLVREEVTGAAVETVALDMLLAEIISEARETGLSVEAGPMVAATVTGRALALKRALRNLVINAATHGRGAKVGLAKVGADTIEVTIVDRGPGIPAHLLDQVFEPFFRVDQARRQMIPGAGLGLAISREIIETNSGTVTIANAPDGGLLQAVRFPVHA